MKRMEVLDVWRSLSFAAMIVHHLCYDLEHFGVLAAGTMASLPLRALSWVCGGSFILLSGACARFSRSGVRRGFVVLCVGALVAAVTAMVQLPVRFGILQMLGVSMIAYALLRHRLERVLGWPFALVCVVLFALSEWVTSSVWVDINFLYPFGFRTREFYSSDYYPLLPWGFLFLIGACFGKYIEKHADHPLLQRSFSAALTFVGRHSLLIYVLHQPLLYGACFLLFG
ncbi:MAG: DUF1624 domain-containing protein [Ruminococcaceae bacterium]|nr:DUF1624 domain-containing protein [Oscillospiraceae bacterium]